MMPFKYVSEKYQIMEVKKWLIATKSYEKKEK